MKPFQLLSLYPSTIAAIFRFLFSGFPILITFMDAILSFYFCICDLSPWTVDLDDKTTVHFWAANHRRFNKPALVMIHGYGGTSRWQFVSQVRTLSKRFNLYVPDLLFFGKYYTTRPDRTDYFQAKCVAEGLKRLGVDKFSVYSISYGGYVAYRMAEMYPAAVEKVVIVSSGIGCTEDQKGEQLKSIGGNVSEILVPRSPRNLRQLVNLSVHKQNPLKWVPDFLLREFIKAMYARRKEQVELLRHLLDNEADPSLPVIIQETLIIWGDKDKVFPLDFARHLQSHLPKSRLEIINNIGHAANLEAPDALNDLITAFVMDIA